MIDSLQEILPECEDAAAVNQTKEENDRLCTTRIVLDSANNAEAPTK